MTKLLRALPFVVEFRIRSRFFAYFTPYGSQQAWFA